MKQVQTYDAKLIEITDGNLRNDHIYLRSALHLIPQDAIGGTNASRPGRQITVHFRPGRTVETDLSEDKLMLRCRSEVGDFFTRSGIGSGHFVLFTRLAEREFEISVVPYR